jgi:hypothetical protein
MQLNNPIPPYKNKWTDVVNCTQKSAKRRRLAPCDGAFAGASGGKMP